MNWKVSDLPHQEKPKSKIALGVSKLNLSELISIVIGENNRKHPSLAIAQRIIAEIPMKRMVEMKVHEFYQYMTSDQAARLVAALALGIKAKTYLEAGPVSMTTFHAPDTVADFMRGKIDNMMKEHFFVISFDTRNKYISHDNISIGTLTASLVHPRETFEAAIRNRAAKIILLHNHPSGDESPSDDDMKITRRLCECGKLFGIEVLDHIIITASGYMSFKEQCLI